MAGCSLLQPAPSIPDRVVEIEDVPFNPQTRYQCGPAALATVLQFNGVAVSPDELSGRLQIPAKKGSLQIELIATAREFGFIPFVLDDNFNAILTELEAGHPVLVLQNLGPTFLPKWHYAVAVGYDGNRGRVLLRSGTERLRRERSGWFLGSWRRAGEWGIVLFRPPDLPATATPDSLVRSLESNGQFLDRSTIGAALKAGLQRWPDDTLLLFALGNDASRNGDHESAAGYYRRLLEVDPSHVGALNNYADTLLSAGCPEAAAGLIRTAVQLSPDDTDMSAIVATTAAEISAARRASRVPEPDHCAALAP